MFHTEYNLITGWAPTYGANQFNTLAEAQAEITHLSKYNSPSNLRIRETTCIETIHPAPSPTFTIQRKFSYGWHPTTNCPSQHLTLAAARAAYEGGKKAYPYMDGDLYRILETPGDLVHSPLAPTTFRIQYQSTGNTIDWGCTGTFATLAEARAAWVRRCNHYGSVLGPLVTTKYSILELPANVSHPCYVAPEPSYVVEQNFGAGTWKASIYARVPFPTLNDALEQVAKIHDPAKSWWTHYRIRETVSGAITPIPTPIEKLHITIEAPQDWNNRLFTSTGEPITITETSKVV